ncbi:MAG: DUF1772 domain-containing protein [Proteobacteria bacterium]|nr:DUF1772 domain-containing protein [Pseudomonadota bacterium]MDE2412032.1 DUF1772 domain-containing protein [Sphingomonadales bacterium]
MLIGLIALVATAAFAGAAFYINFAEHPARAALSSSAAVRQWAPSYKRGFVMQSSLAIVGGICAGLQWYLGGGAAWLFGGLILLANWPFTLLIIMPVNRRLLTYEALPEGDVGALLGRWNRLHAVRTALGVAAVAAMLFAAVNP